MNNVITASLNHSNESIARALAFSAARGDDGIIYCSSTGINPDSITDSPYIVLRRSRTKGLDGLFIGQVKQIVRLGDKGMKVMLADKSGRPWDKISTDPTVALQIIEFRQVGAEDRPAQALHPLVLHGPLLEWSPDLLRRAQFAQVPTSLQTPAIHLHLRRT